MCHVVQRGHTSAVYSRAMKYILLVVAVLSLSACGSSPVTPSSEDMSGTWSGTQNTTLGQNTVSVSVSQSGSSLRGTWSSLFPSSPNNNNGGQFTGTKSGASVSLTLTPSVPTNCPFTFTGTLTTVSNMSGTFAAFSCTVSNSGTLSLNKQ